MTKVNADNFLIHSKKILPKDSVLNSKMSEKYCADTSGLKREIAGALLPTSMEQIQEIVKLANQYKISLYTISRGNNWGFGSTHPAIDHCFILDLSKMNKILDFDETLGVVVLEPGVTHQQLYEYIKSHGDGFLVPTVGGGPHCSLVGNALDKGFGPAANINHFLAVNDLEAVLPNATLYRSLLKDQGCPEISSLYKWGVGPYLDGLFAQSNLGIVTKMAIALKRRPDNVTFFSVGSNSLGDIIDSMREIKQTLDDQVSNIIIMNKYRILLSFEPYDKRLCDVNINQKNLLDELANKNNLQEWTVVAAVYSEKDILKSHRVYIKKTLIKNNLKRPVFLDGKRIRFLKLLTKFIPLPSYRRQVVKLIGSAEAALQLFSGIPSEAALETAYWKRTNDISSMKRPLNPARDGCGLIWFDPIISTKISDVEQVERMTWDICFKHHMEPLCNFGMVSSNYIFTTIMLLFNPENQSEKDRAHACYMELFNEFKKQGFFPYRLSTHEMNKLNKEDSVYWDIATKIKLQLDPNNILSPNRYIPDLSS